ncbi:hypothetical protein DFH06DRAFT_1203819 [Mycena polygramma]|nr:hypothetical protein DFH06DRAFT_1203819 [Mycena polygramma]
MLKVVPWLLAHSQATLMLSAPFISHLTAPRSSRLPRTAPSVLARSGNRLRPTPPPVLILPNVISSYLTLNLVGPKVPQES